MAITFVNAVDGTNSGGASSSVTITGTTAGNSLLISSRWNGPDATAISSLTCTDETVVQGSPILQAGSSGSYNQFVWSIIEHLSSGGSKTINMTISDASGDTNALTVLEFSGTALSGGVMGTPVAENSPVSTSPVDIDVVTSAANSAVVCFQMGTGGSVIVSSGPTGNGTWSLFDTQNVGGFCRIDYNVDTGAAGTKNVQYTFSSSPTTRCGILAVELKAEGAGGGSEEALSGSAATGGHGTASPVFSIEL